MGQEWTVEGGIICFDLPPIPEAGSICFPGDFCLDSIWNGINQIPHAADIPLQFFSQIGPAMSALKPLFDLLDFALAIFRCVKAVPDSITKLDPTELFKCMPPLVKIINKLLSMIPQMSVPRMVKRLLLMLSQLLEGIATDFRYIQSQLQRIADAIDRAADLQDVTLNNFLVCSQRTLRESVMSTSEALKGIGRIILLVNVFMGLFGGPEIPCFGKLIDDNLDKGLDEVIRLLTLFARMLREISNAIPDPVLMITETIGALSC